MTRPDLATLFKAKRRILIPLFAVFVLAGYFGVREFWRWWGVNRVWRGLAREEAEFRRKSESLEAELKTLAQPEVLEKEARSRLNLKKEGEQVLVVVSEDNFPEENFLKAESESVFDKKGTVWFNVKSWRDYFFSK